MVIQQFVDIETLQLIKKDVISNADFIKLSVGDEVWIPRPVDPSLHLTIQRVVAEFDCKGLIMLIRYYVD